MNAKKESYIWDEIDINEVCNTEASSKNKNFQVLEFRNENGVGKKGNDDSEFDVLSEISSALQSQRLSAAVYPSNRRANRSYSSNRSVESAISSLDDDVDDDDIATYQLPESRTGIKVKEESFDSSSNNDNLTAIAAHIEEKLKAMKEELRVRDTKGKELKVGKFVSLFISVILIYLDGVTTVSCCYRKKAGERTT